jgi:hypothetical protein
MLNLKSPSLFLMGFIQVYFVAVNVYFLSKELYIGVFVSSFLINIIWTENIKKIAFGSAKDRINYALGASVGSIAGLFSSSIIASLL